MRKVHLVQINHMYGKAAFLPYSVGSLWAYAVTDPVIKAAYELDGFTYLRGSIDEMVNKLPHDLDVLGLSCYIWNSSITHALAEAAKKRFPNCLVMMGGPHVPDRSDGYFQSHPYADALIHDEGEEIVADVLKERLESKPDYSKVQGVTVNEGGISRKTKPHARIDDLDKIPSPYLTGLFDNLMPLPYEWLLTQEASRGCLAAGSKINTIEGIKPIEAVLPGELVLGWDEDQNKLVWNTVRCSVKTGTLPTLEIVVGDRRVKATSDHPFYTRRGWVAAGELRTTDMVLQCLWQSERRESVCDMLDRVSKNRQPSPGDGAWGEMPCGIFGTQTDTNLQDVPKGIQQTGLRYLFSSMRQGCEECMECKAQKNTTSKILQGLRYRNAASQRKTKSVYVLGGLFKRGHQQRQTRGPESCQTARGQRKDLSYSEGDGSGTICANHQTASRGSHTLSPRSRKQEKQIRDQGAGVCRSLRAPFSLRRLRRFLGRSLPEWAVSQPGFHPHQNEEKNSVVSPRQVLARHGGQFGSDPSCGLYELRVEGIHSLGRRQTERSPGCKDSEIRWVEVMDVKQSGFVDVYDLVGAQPYPNFFANDVLVHNCPYQCEFCSWGSAVFTKLRKFSIDRLQDEFEWAAKNRIEMLYSADSNWAIFDRDVEITERMIKVKEKYGYPKKFRAAYAKNSNDRVFQVSKMLNDAGMSKGTTLSFQSLDEHTLEIVKRKNMKTNDFKGLMHRYSAAGIPTYSEMICGLPGETYDTWVDGFDRLLSASPAANVNCYSCEILPNAGMGDPVYQAKYGIKSVETPVLFFHASQAQDEPPELTEHYHIVTSTNDLPPSDWLKSQLFAHAIQAFHCISEGTLVTTKDGRKPIESVTADDWVLSWNEDRQETEWSQCQRSVFQGRKPTYEVTYQSGSVEGTADHEVFTDRGWRTIGELQLGDKVLFNMRQFACRETTKTKVLHQPLLDDFYGKGRKNKTSYGEWVLQRGERTNSKAHERRSSFKTTRSEGKIKSFSNETSIESRSQKSPIRYHETTLCFGCHSSGSVVGRDQSFGDQEHQSYNGNRGVQDQDGCCIQSWLGEGGRNKKTKDSDWRDGYLLPDRRREKTNQRTNEKQQSNERSGGSGKSWCETVNQNEDQQHHEQPRSSKELGGGTGTKAQSVRGPYHYIYGNARSAISVHRRWPVLGAAQRIQQKQESGFHSQKERNETGGTGSRDLLAPRSRTSGFGNTALQERRMAGIHHLGRARTQQEDGEQDTIICRWETVQDIRYSGYKKVYDLLNVTPNNNFFAGGILVHNCMGLTQKLAVYAKYRHGIAYRRFYEGLIGFAESNPSSVLAAAYDAALASYSRLRRGLEWGFQDKRFGDIIWPVEEGGFLICASDADRFYDELCRWLVVLMPDDLYLGDALTVQMATLKLPYAQPKEIHVGSNIVEYLDSCYQDKSIELIREPTTYRIIDGVDYGGDLETYSREITWFGRKGGHPFWHTERESND